MISEGARGLEALVLVARLGSMARAAEALAYSASSISRVIARLERLTGHELVRKTASGSSLTDDGRAMVAVGCAILCGWQKAVSASAEPGAQQPSCLAGDVVDCVGIGGCPGAVSATAMLASPVDECRSIG